jgi:transposase-like protein
MKKQRRKHSPEFKAKVAIEAIKGVKTVSQIAQEHEIHPVMVSTWKKEMLSHLPDVL